MGRPIRDLCFVALVVSALVTACAGVIGVEDPILDPAALNPGGEGGPGRGVEGGAPVACSSTPDTCPPHSYCAKTNECTPGCQIDDDCKPPTPHCSATHQCVTCRGDGDCTNGDKCTPAGRCVALCTGTGPCGKGGTCCAPYCIDTRGDELNCGGCGTVCSSAHGTPTCTKSTCEWACANNWLHCAAGNTGCETASNTLANCGACGNNCATAVKNTAGPLCAGAKCDYTTCNAGFTDLDGNRANGCETPCGKEGQACCGTTCNPPLSCQDQGGLQCAKQQ